MAKLTIRNRYGTVPNELLNRTDISMKAKGLFAFMQSKPDGWSFSVERISNQTLEGKEAIQSGIKELEDAGYLKRTPCKKSDGTWDGYDYYLTDTPLTGNPQVVEALAEKPATFSNKDSSKKDIVIKNLDSEQSSRSDPHLIGEVIKSFEEINPVAKSWYKHTTQRKAVSELIDCHGFDTVMRVVAFLPRSNQMEYIPTVTSPIQLRDKWASLSAALLKKQRSFTPSTLKV